MLDIPLDPRLEKDCHFMGEFDSSSVLLLMRNSLFPWFVLVPRTKEIEFYKLEPELQTKVLEQINLLSQFIEDNFSIDKLNIGSIGNIVSQLHIHVVGRRRDDVRWPDVVWGVKEFKVYEPGQLSDIKKKLDISFQRLFRVHRGTHDS
jgi:diadenosine tetraphosphate (Ap4A) HIT family hydrolase